MKKIVIGSLKLYNTLKTNTGGQRYGKGKGIGREIQRFNDCL